MKFPPQSCLCGSQINIDYIDGFCLNQNCIYDLSVGFGSHNCDPWIAFTYNNYRIIYNFKKQTFCPLDIEIFDASKVTSAIFQLDHHIDFKILLKKINYLKVFS